MSWDDWEKGCKKATSLSIGTNNIQVTIFISITIFCLSCAKTWPRRMWRRRSRRTSRWTRMLPSWKVRGGQGSKWGWYQIRTLHTIQIKWSNMLVLVGECAIMSIKHRPYKWTTSFHRERLRFLLWIFKWPHDQLNATKLVRVVCKTQKLKDKTYILREFELMVLGHLALTSIFLEKLRDYNCIQSDWEKH